MQAKPAVRAAVAAGVACPTSVVGIVCPTIQAGAMEQLEVAAVRLGRPGREADGAVNEMAVRSARVRKDGSA